jgi:hypothetical protein
MKRKYLVLLSTTLTLGLTANFAAIAQSPQPATKESSDSSASLQPEIKMSPEGMQILCQRFPLNSRCQSPTATQTDSQNVSEPPASSTPENLTNPNGTTQPSVPKGTEPNPSNSNPATSNLLSPPSGSGLKD